MTAIGDIPAAERGRFAICYLHMTDKNDVDWAKASAAYDAKVKEASFKTVTSRAVKKIEALAAQEGLSEGDTNRFALCFAYAQDKQAVDWPAAAAKYDSKVKPESFRTVTQRALRKHGFVAATKKTTSTASKKRKATKDEVESAEAEGDLTMPKKKPRKYLKSLQLTYPQFELPADADESNRDDAKPIGENITVIKAEQDTGDI